MQLLDLPLAIGFGVSADAGIEGARRVVQGWVSPALAPMDPGESSFTSAVENGSPP
jgi:hypothetical protein